ncbi:MAG TPA: DMT family transporter [Aestuariivirgaceae bacterium]|nr:DMT family transporter [Aestuariivirgaceae bacterium]
MRFNSPHRKYLLGILLVLLATVGWSLAGIFVRLLPGLNGWQINCWRGLSLSLFLLIYLIAAYGRDWQRRFQVVPAVAMFAGAGFFALGSTLYVTSLTLTSTANVSCIGAMAPLFVAAAGRVFLGERPHAVTWMAALLALFGVTLIFQDGLDRGNWLGSVVAIAVAICFAGQTVTLRRYRNLDMMPAICLGGLVAFLAAGLFGGGFAVPPSHIAVLALMGLVQLAIPLILFARAARYVQAATLSLIALLDAVLNPFWSWLGVGEIPAVSAFIGGSIILGAVALSIIAGARFNFQSQPSMKPLPPAD